MAPLNTVNHTMKTPHHVFVRHVPFGKPYQGKREQDAFSYDAAIKAATAAWPKVVNACQLKVTFALPPDKFADRKCLGPDLDNLLKRLLDDLKATIFAAPADDSFIVSLEATKTKVQKSEAGVHIEVVPLDTILNEKTGD